MFVLVSSPLDEYFVAGYFVERYLLKGLFCCGVTLLKGISLEGLFG